MQIFDYSFIQNHSGNSARSFNHHHNGNWALSFNHHHIGNWAHSFNHHHNGNWAHSFNHYHNGNCSSFMQSQWQLQLIHAIFLMLHIFSVWCTTAHISYRVYTWKHFVYCSGEGPMMWVKEREWVCGHRKYHSIYIENCIITMHKYRCVVFLSARLLNLIISFIYICRHIWK